MVTAFTIDGKDSYEDFYMPCERDNIETFLSDGKYKVDEGATKCDPSDDQTYENGSWSISGNKLTMSAEDSPIAVSIDVTVVELSDTKLKYSQKDEFTEGTTFVYTLTAK